MLSSPTASLISNYTSVGRSDGLDILREGNNYYGYLTTTSGKLFLLNFGSSWNSPPTLSDLGTVIPGYDINLIKDGNNVWHAYISTTNSKLYRLDFDNGIEGAFTTTDLGNFGGIISSPRGIRTLKIGSDIYVLATSSNLNTLSVIKFTGGVSGTSTSRSINIPGGAQIIGLALARECEQIFAIVSDVTTRKFYRIGLGNNPMDSTLTNITELTSLAGPTAYDLDLIIENNRYYLMIPSFNGTLYHADFGESITNPSPTIKNLGDFGVLDKILGAEFVLDSSRVTGLVYNYITYDLHRISYPNVCSASMPYSEDTTPANISYDLPGKKYIEVKGFDSNGNMVKRLDSLTVLELPDPDFTTDKSCLGENTLFADNSLSFNGQITSWVWDFDGLGSSTNQNPAFAFPAAGVYNITLTVNDTKGCTNSIVKSITVYDNNDIQPDFLTPSLMCSNDPANFTDQSTYVADTIKAWLWSFNGEGSSVLQNPEFTFQSGGSKIITLSVTGVSGCVYSTTQALNVETGPATAFAFTNVCNGQATTFTDQTTGNNLTAWNWDFGDGTSATNQNPSHLYASPGKYAVTLTVSNSLGCTTSFADTVYNHALPAVAFTNDLPCSSAPIQFTDQSIVQDANMVAWAWDFGDGSTATERNPQHLYGQTGDFTVKLKAYSQFGCVDSLSTTVSVIQGPEVDFSWDKGCAGEPASFTDLTNSFGLPVTNYTWLIDNKVFSEQNPQYTFTAAGTYTVQFSVTTNNLCAQTVSKAIVVEDPPATSFAYFESCDDNTVTFYDTTPPTMATREWRINGTPTATDSVMTTSLTPDTYRISLTTVSTAGCTGVSMQDIGIVGAPVANFTPSTQYGAVPLTVQFSNQSTGADSFLWQFGDADNTTSTETNPVFTYIDLGAYEVRLIAAGGQNCGDTIRQTVEVVEPVHGLAIDAITPLDNGKIALTLTNLGSYSYTQDNIKLIFTLDNGAEITEDFSTTLYPKKSLNYVPDISLGNAGNSKILCATVRYFTANPAISLDKNCLTLNNQPLIAEAYPNPARDYINLAVVLPTPGTVHISLIDRNGAVVLTDTYEAAEQGLNSYTVDTTPYRAGLYIIKIETGGKAKKMKVVVTR